ncbi:hypothetical protein [Roseofilum sp. Guam]|nr:hypothetical protein [Roseofilum sp. Guam]
MGNSDKHVGAKDFLPLQNLSFLASAKIYPVQAKLLLMAIAP